MAELTVTVNGHNYVVACKAGEEEHLKFLADYMARKVASLVVSFGQIGEARLLLMASLMVADDLSEAYKELADLRAEIAELRAKVESDAPAESKADGPARAGEDELAALIGGAARRVAELAERIESGA